MNNLAIISVGGKQHLVRPNSIVRLGKLPKEGKRHVFSDLLSGKKVHVEVISEGRSRKVIVRKFKSKVRYLRRKSHRAPITVIRINKISG